MKAATRGQGSLSSLLSSIFLFFFFWTLSDVETVFFPSSQAISCGGTVLRASRGGNECRSSQLFVCLFFYLQWGNQHTLLPSACEDPPVLSGSARSDSVPHLSQLLRRRKDALFMWRGRKTERKFINWWNKWVSLEPKTGGSKNKWCCDSRGFNQFLRIYSKLKGLIIIFPKMFEEESMWGLCCSTKVSIKIKVKVKAGRTLRDLNYFICDFFFSPLGCHQCSEWF